MTPISQMAHISIPEPRQILIKPFDVSALKELVKAVTQSDLGSAPQNDGKVLRITLPPLSGVSFSSCSYIKFSPSPWVVRGRLGGSTGVSSNFDAGKGRGRRTFSERSRARGVAPFPGR